MAESIPRYTSTADGFRTADEIAALRPVKANAPRPRKASAQRAMVSTGIVCFCSERFSESQALEFMKHLRAEVGDDLAVLERKRQSERRRTREYLKRKAEDPEWREQSRARRRARERRRNENPEYHERQKERKRIEQARKRANPDLRASVNQQRREAWAADPELRERRLAWQREYRVRKKAEREAQAHG
jgi:hypothetical protein